MSAISRVAITGVGCWLPEERLTNTDLQKTGGPKRKGEGTDGRIYYKGTEDTELRIGKGDATDGRIYHEGTRNTELRIGKKGDPR